MKKFAVDVTRLMRVYPKNYDRIYCEIPSLASVDNNDLFDVSCRGQEEDGLDRRVGKSAFVVDLDCALVNLGTFADEYCSMDCLLS